MSDRVVLCIGTEKGLFIAESSADRNSFDLRGPFAPAQVPHRDADEVRQLRGEQPGRLVQRLGHVHVVRPAQSPGRPDQRDREDRKDRAPRPGRDRSRQHAERGEGGRSVVDRTEAR